MAEEHTGGMIALVPEQPERFTVPGGDPAEQMHLTLVYLGDDVASWPPEIIEALKSGASNLAQGYGRTEAKIFGHSIWNPDSEDFEPASVYELSDNGILCAYAERAQDMAHIAMGALYPDQHVPYKPHITAGYNLEPGLLTETGDVEFHTLRLALGGENFDYPLSAYTADSPYAVEGKMEMAETKTEAAPPPETEIPEEVPELDDSNGLAVTFPVVIVEGLETDDGRYIVPGALTHRALPLPILAQTSNPDGGEGHDGAEVIGRLDTLTRQPGPEVIDKETGKPFPEGTFVWSATGFVDPEAHGTKLARKGYLTGNSADLSGVEAEFVWAEEDGGEPQSGPKQIRMTAGKVAATTLVPIPAFAQSYMVIDGQEAKPNAETITAAAAPAWRSAELGDDCLPCAAGLDLGSVQAAATPIGRKLPPAHAFADPVLDGPTALTLDEDSIPGFIEVYGHLATWGTCHTSFPNACITPPRSHEDYAYFNTGAVRVRDADRTYSVAAGRITMGEGGHASTALSAADAAAHYDNVNTVVADVTAGEDQFGIWVHGVMRKTATPEQIDALRASPLSGDWRPFNGGSLELVAALAVNTGGFPVPRVRVASGVPMALVAAGVVPQTHASAALVDLDAVADEVERRIAQRALLAVRQQKALVDLAIDHGSRMREALAELNDLGDRGELAMWGLEFEPDAEAEELAKKKPNWVEKAGGLPPYIKRIAKHLKEKGMDESRAIATAVNAAKKMCSTGDVSFPGKQQVNPGSQAEACAAVADWEAKKAAS